ncbi:MAG TPA: hypothetical protein VEW04_03280 [Allosphingosinicella sp.]|nr:hypothetical protein [Allosphingosinicella sp.]
MTIRTIAAALGRVAAAIQLSMCKLNELQFSAPWNPKVSRCTGRGL